MNGNAKCSTVCLIGYWLPFVRIVYLNGLSSGIDYMLSLSPELALPIGGHNCPNFNWITCIMMIIISVDNLSTYKYVNLSGVFMIRFKHWYLLTSDYCI